jgi:hypothetical protein
MTPEAQNLAVLTACGWTDLRLSTPWEVTDPPELPVVPCGIHPKTKTKTREQAPDCANDLNAVHEAEKTLTISQQGGYSIRLSEVVRRSCLSADGNVKEPFIASWYWHATAAQRLEALVRTLNLWDDSK